MINFRNHLFDIIKKLRKVDHDISSPVMLIYSFLKNSEKEGINAKFEKLRLRFIDIAWTNSVDEKGFVEGVSIVDNMLKEILLISKIIDGMEMEDIEIHQLLKTCVRKIQRILGEFLVQHMEQSSYKQPDQAT